MDIKDKALDLLDFLRLNQMIDDKQLSLLRKAILEDRQTGHWIDIEVNYYANCSECGYQIDVHEHGYHNYCPECGSRMRRGSR